MYMWFPRGPQVGPHGPHGVSRVSHMGPLVGSTWSPLAAKQNVRPAPDDVHCGLRKLLYES